LEQPQSIILQAIKQEEVTKSTGISVTLKRFAKQTITYLQTTFAEEDEPEDHY